ncbi:MAG: hypothetical protein ABIN67_07060, partial [Ferruginibacter sp.]
MKIFCLVIIILFPFFCSSQNSPQKFRQKSWQTFAYMITAAEAEKFIAWDSIAVDHFIEREPTMVFHADSVDEEKLAVGNYVLININGIYVNADFLCISKLVVLPVNNKQRLQLDIRNKAGEFIPGAKVFVNNVAANYDEESKTFRVNKRKLQNVFLKVYAPGDTLYVTLPEKEDYYAKSIWQQRWQNWRQTRVFNYLSWIPSRIKTLFRPRYTYKSSRIGAKGFIVFNQPKYKPLDTVKFKGYVVNKHGNQYKKDVEVHLVYNIKGKSNDQVIATLQPVSPGAFAGQFILSDTIPADISCRLIFKTARKKEIIQNQFSIEDYVLDEIGSYAFSSDKEIYFKND